MIHRYIFHNEKLLPIEQVRLSPGQAGLLNGWGLFTTLRIVEGQLLGAGVCGEAYLPVHEYLYVSRPALLGQRLRQLGQEVLADYAGQLFRERMLDLFVAGSFNRGCIRIMGMEGESTARLGFNVKVSRHAIDHEKSRYLTGGMFGTVLLVELTLAFTSRFIDILGFGLPLFKFFVHFQFAFGKPHECLHGPVHFVVGTNGLLVVVPP